MSTSRRGRPTLPVGTPASGSAEFTRLESLLILVVLCILGMILIPSYLKLVQHAREIRIRATLNQIIRAQETYRLAELETGHYAGDFEELESASGLPGGSNLEPARSATIEPGVSRTESARVRDDYRFDLQADFRTDGSASWCVTASPTNQPRKRRWYYADESGVIRSAVGLADRESPVLP